MLEEIRREKDLSKQGEAVSMSIGVDPELDEFMVSLAFPFSQSHNQAYYSIQSILNFLVLILYHVQETYCNVLLKYKTDLSRPYDEATTFLNKIETQLSNLSKGWFIYSINYLVLTSWFAIYMRIYRNK